MNEYRVTIRDTDGDTMAVWVEARSVEHALMLVAVSEDWSESFIERLDRISCVIETN